MNCQFASGEAITVELMLLLLVIESSKECEYYRVKECAETEKVRRDSVEYSQWIGAAIKRLASHFFVHSSPSVQSLSFSSRRDALCQVFATCQARANCSERANRELESSRVEGTQLTL